MDLNSLSSAVRIPMSRSRFPGPPGEASEAISVNALRCLPLGLESILELKQVFTVDEVGGPDGRD